MAIELPETASELVTRSKTDVQRLLPETDPFAENSLEGAIVAATGNRTYDFYLQLDELQTILLPDSSVGEFIERWAAIYGLQRLAATKATGNFICGGTPSSSIPISTNFVSSSGQIYTSTASTSISTIVTSITSLTRSGNVVTAVCATEHNLAVNIPVTIAGAVETDYNVVNKQILQVVDEFTFTYEIATTPTTPATGTITATYDIAVVPVESDQFQDSANDVNVNLESGTLVNLQSPLTGVDNTAGVGAVPIGGGTDQETDIQLSGRLLERIQQPVANFNVAAIQAKAKEVAGVTRVFVFEITPAIGQQTIYFMRDNDSDPIPDAGEVATVKNKILEIKPANTATADVIVAAPTAVVTPFTFTSLVPNTESMQNAIEANLQQFFAEETQVGVDVQQDAYRAAIQNTVDTETGQRVQDFTLSTPTGDISVATGQIATLGTVTPAP